MTVEQLSKGKAIVEKIENLKRHIRVVEAYSQESEKIGRNVGLSYGIGNGSLSNFLDEYLPIDSASFLKMYKYQLEHAIENLEQELSKI